MYKEKITGYYYINNGCDINICNKDNFLGTLKISRYQKFDDYFITLAEWREQQFKS